MWLIEFSLRYQEDQWIKEEDADILENKSIGKGVGASTGKGWESELMDHLPFVKQLLRPQPKEQKDRSVNNDKPGGNGRGRKFPQLL